MKKGENSRKININCQWMTSTTKLKKPPSSCETKKRRMTMRKKEAAKLVRKMDQTIVFLIQREV